MALRLLPLVEELKIKTKDLQIVRFGDVMNYAQRDLIEECERQLADTGQIRVIVLKARQMGLSTAIEAVLFAMAFLVDYFRVLIVSHEMDSSQHILSMCDTYWRTFCFRDFYNTRYAGRKELQWVETHSGIRVDTAGGKGVGRSQTITALHASEVAFWPNPEELVNGLRQAIPSFGTTAIFYESTANGVGNWFHKTWKEAVADRNELTAKFYPWWQHPEYTASYIGPGEAAKYGLDSASLTAEEKVLRGMGIDDARLVWRRYAIKNLCGGDINKFHQEYPSTPDEAFISTGRNVFPLQRLLAHYKPREGVRGRLALLDNRVRFIECSQFEGGDLRVFNWPSADEDHGVYIIGADPTHTATGDYACAQVVNRRTLEQVAVYRRKCDPITFAQDLALLGRWYNTALIVPEKEGPGYATVGHLVGNNYPRVWESERVDSTRGKGMGTYGWNTTKQSKHLAISNLLKCVVDDLAELNGNTYGLVIHDDMTIAEMRDYVSSPTGDGYENSDGSEYDDGVMALATALTVHFIEPQPAAYGLDDGFRAAKLTAVEPQDGHSASYVLADKREQRAVPGEAPWQQWGAAQ